MKYYYVVYCFRGDFDRLYIDSLSTYPFEKVTVFNLQIFLQAIEEMANSMRDYMTDFKVISWQEIEVD